MEARAENTATISPREFVGRSRCRALVGAEKETHGGIPRAGAAYSSAAISLANLRTFIARAFRFRRARTETDFPDSPSCTIFQPRNNMKLASANATGFDGELDLRADLWDPASRQAHLTKLPRLPRIPSMLWNPFRGKDTWKLAASYAGSYGEAHREGGIKLVMLRACWVHTVKRHSQESFVKYGPAIAEGMCARRSRAHIEQILAQPRRRRQTCLFEPSSRTNPGVSSIEQAAVNNARPASLDICMAHVGCCASGLRADLRTGWDRQFRRPSCSSAPAKWRRVEKTPDAILSTRIEYLLGWQERVWLPAQNLRIVGFRWEKVPGRHPGSPLVRGELGRIRESMTEGFFSILDSA